MNRTHINEGGIIRAPKNNGYKAMSVAPYEDDRLSWEARGVLAFLLSRPDNWQVRPSTLERAGCKRDKVQRILRELEQAGYLRREKRRIQGGRFEWISTVYETPQPENTVLVDEPQPGLPLPENTLVEQTASESPKPRSTTTGFTVNGKHGNLSNKDLKKEEGAAPPKGGRSRTPRRDVIFETLASECGIDWTVCTSTQRQQLNQSTSIIRKSGEKHGQDEAAIAETIRYVASYYRRNDWRGKKGEPATPAALREIWGAAVAERAQKAAAVVQPQPAERPPVVSGATMRAAFEAANLPFRIRGGQS